MRWPAKSEGIERAASQRLRRAQALSSLGVSERVLAGESKIFTLRSHFSTLLKWLLFLRSRTTRRVHSPARGRVVWLAVQPPLPSPTTYTTFMAHSPTVKELKALLALIPEDAQLSPAAERAVSNCHSVVGKWKADVRSFSSS